MHRLIRRIISAAAGPALILILAFMTPQAIFGEEASTADAVIAPLIEAVYAQLMTEEDIYSLHQETLERVDTEIDDDAEAARARALTHYYLGRWHQAFKDRPTMVEYAGIMRDERYLALRRFYTEKEEAMAAYRNARREAEICLELRPDAESHRVYGEILGQMLFLGDVGDLFDIGGKAKRNVKKALKMDPEHIKARIQDASRMAYTPPAYGGDYDGARDALRSILRDGVNEREDLFNIYGAYGMAAFMEGNDDEAASWFSEASALYPGNIFAAGMVDFLKGIQS